MRNRTIQCLTFALCLQFPINFLAAGWGLERGRADGGDVARLLVDQISMKMAQHRVSEAIRRPLAIERQRQLLGDSDGGTETADLLDKITEWWLKDVLGPAESISGNPAASCAEAQVAAQSLLGMMRQRSLLGMSPELDSASGSVKEGALDTTTDLRTDRIFRKLTLRCQEEALDECLATGRLVQIIQTEFAFGTQQQLLGGSAGDGSWVDNALKQCAIYELHLVSTTKVPQLFNLSMVRDTKIKLEFQAEPGGILSAIKAGKKLEDMLKGETKGGANPFFISVKCSQPPIEVVCMGGATLNPFASRVSDLELRHREFYVDATGVSKERVVGKNSFVFEISNGIYGIDAVVKVPGAPAVPVPMKGIGYSFYTAHKKDRPAEGLGAGVTIRLERETRGAYPVMFEFTYADQGNEGGFTASDSTEFKLIHKPKPDPLPTRSPEPARKPLRTKNAGN